MAAPTITNGQEHFSPIIYEGNGGGQRVGRFVPFTDNGTIDNSCIFNGATAQARVGRTPSSNGSGTILTFSAWVKRGRLGSISSIFIANDYASVGEALEFNTSNQLNYYCIKSSPGSYDWNYITNRTFEDTSKWYHIYIRRDTTDSTAADRVQIYIDGERVTSWNTETQAGSNLTGWMNQTTYENSFGNTNNASYVRGIGYLAEVNMIDGSNPAISTFGVTDTSTGRWVPKALTGITYGTNGFRCKFQDSSALGDDTSGNGNDLASTNLASTDQTTDSPTQNHCTWDPNDHANLAAFSEGNLKVTGGSASTSGSCRGTLAPKSGKYYFEIKFLGGAFAGHNSLGIRNKNVAINSTTSGSGVTTESYHWRDDGYAINGTLGQMNSGFSSYTTNDYIGVAMDLDTGKVWMSKNGTYEKSGNPVTGENPMFTVPTGQPYAPWWLGYGYTNNNELNCGQRAFNTDPPTGFLALQQDNLPSAVRGISDFLIIKNRDAADSWMWQDSLRGSGQYGSSSTATQYNTAITDGVQKFLAGGFSTEDNDAINTSGESYVAYNFHLNGGTTTTDTTGTLSTELQANATAGFSVGKFTVSGSGNVTWAHGLGGVPEMGILCAFDSTNYGTTYHHKTSSTPYSNYLLLTTNAGVATSSNIWGSAKPTSTLWTGLVNSLFTAGGVYVFYSFRSIEGFSKFNSFTGNGSTNGPFVYTGFKPSWIMVKRNDSSNDWQIFDAARNPFNPVDRRIYFNLTNTEAVGSTSDIFDFTSNGFKVREDNAAINASGGTYIYWAMAENPFVGDGTSPVTAR
jgi:hypothetical protein